MKIADILGWVAASACLICALIVGVALLFPSRGGSDN